MSVTIRVNYYSDICDSFVYGRKVLALPDCIVDAIDNYFDSMEIDYQGIYNPDNFYINHLYQSSLRDILVLDLHYLNQSEFSELIETGEIEDYVRENFDRIVDDLSERYYFLGYVGNCFYTVR